ncbi:Uncharacterized protein FWK35_00026123, partial [Aphis craccivora]
KSVLSYLAYLKIGLNKMSDTQQEILQMLSNLPNNHFNDKTNFVDEEIDYFISSWPLQNHDSLEQCHDNKQESEDIKLEFELNLSLKDESKSSKYGQKLIPYSMCNNHHYLQYNLPSVFEFLQSVG